MEERKRQSDLMRVSEVVGRELDRLEALEGDELAAELERAKMVKGLSETLISNCNAVLQVYRYQAERKVSAALPRQLTGGQ